MFKENISFPISLLQEHALSNDERGEIRKDDVCPGHPG